MEDKPPDWEEIMSTLTPEMRLAYATLQDSLRETLEELKDLVYSDVYQGTPEIAVYLTFVRWAAGQPEQKIRHLLASMLISSVVDDMVFEEVDNEFGIQDS